MNADKNNIYTLYYNKVFDAISFTAWYLLNDFLLLQALKKVLKEQNGDNYLKCAMSNLMSCGSSTYR